VVCGVPDERALLEAHQALHKQGVRSTVFVEPDLGNRLTALAAEPVSGARRRLFRRFPLLRLSSVYQPGRDGFHGGSWPLPGTHPEVRTMTDHQSRFGFHPCDYRTFL
jgi:hypothetical protein